MRLVKFCHNFKFLPPLNLLTSTYRRCDRSRTFWTELDNLNKANSNFYNKNIFIRTSAFPNPLIAAYNRSSYSVYNIFLYVTSIVKTLNIYFTLNTVHKLKKFHIKKLHCIISILSLVALVLF